MPPLELFGVDQAPGQFHGGDGFGLRSRRGNSAQGKNANRQSNSFPCEEHTHPYPRLDRSAARNDSICGPLIHKTEVVVEFLPKLSKGEPDYIRGQYPT